MSIRRRDLLLASILILAVWQAAAWLINHPILPTPLSVLLVFWRDLANGELLGHFLVSLWRVLAGTLLAILTAAPAGLALGQSKRANQLFSPIIYLLYPIPKVVFVPIILLFFGIGDAAKIVIIFLILFFQILVLVRDQAASLRPELIQSVMSLGAGRRALFKYVYLPASLPAILTALRQNVGTAVVISLQTVGVGLAAAMLITPAATAYLLTRRLAPMMFISAGIGAFSSLIGLYLSYYLNIVSGSAIVLTATAVFLVVFMVKRGKR